MRRVAMFVTSMSLMAGGLTACSFPEDPATAATTPPAAQTKKTSPEQDKNPQTGDRMVFQNFDGATLPVNGDGDGFPNNHPGGPRGEGGKTEVSLEKTDAIFGQSLR